MPTGYRLKRKRLLLALAALIALGGLWLFFRRDAYLARAVETYGSQILGVKVTLKRAHLDVAGQSVELHGLVVGNPAGFKGRELLRLDLARVSLDVSSLASDVVLVREITLLKPEITYEKVGGVSNVDALQRNADSYVRAFQGTPTKGAAAPTAPQKRWIIDDVVVRDAQALVLEDLLVTKSLTVSVPNVHLRNIGRRTHGATTADATQQVLSALTASVGNAVGSALNGVAKGVGREVGKGVKNLSESLHGLFGR